MLEYATFVVRHRLAVLIASLCLTTVLALQLGNLSVVVDADELLPKDHPFVQVTEEVQARFGNRFTVVVGITANTGDVWEPRILHKVLQATKALAAAPGVNTVNLQSLAADRAKDISGDADGLRVARLMDAVPADRAGALQIAARLRENHVYRNILVSADGRTAAIFAEFKKDPKGFGSIRAKIDAIVNPLRDDSVTVSIAGQPVFLAALESFSKRMAWLLPIAIVIIGLVHLEAFRSVQGLVLPLMTALLATLWALGLMTVAGVHLDPFNNVTPILILAVAAGHAVQILKRYYEEYHVLVRGGLAPEVANRDAVVRSLVRVGPVMIAAGLIASLTFLSLAVFHIQAIRSFGIFAGLGIFCIVLVELTFTPALRAMLRAPSLQETHSERAATVWSAMSAYGAGLVATADGRWRILLVWALISIGAIALASQIRIDNSLRGFFGSTLEQHQDDARLNQALAGTNTFYVLVDGRAPDAIKDPAVLKGMETVQAFLAKEPQIGGTLSVADMLKQINKAMNANDPAFLRLPDSPDLISQYLLLYAMSGQPGDFDGIVDYPYQRAIIQAFVKTDSSAYVESLNARLQPLLRASFPSTVDVRLGGSITTPTAMNEVMVSGKLLNMAQIFAAVLFVSAVLFRSLTLAGLILAPLAATALAIFGLMGLTGIPLQIATATVSALALGIGADYAIYLAWRLREELSKPVDESTAIAAAYAGAGKAILFVATAVAGGYAVLMLSPGFNIHFWLGLLIAVAMAVAAVSTLTLFAALLIWLRPRVVFGARAHPGLRSYGTVTAAAVAVGFLGATAIMAQSAHAQAQDPEALALMERADAVTRFPASQATGRFVLINADAQTRIRETASISALQPDGVSQKRVVRFTAPADISGTAVLTIENPQGDDDIWVYLPALKKVRRLPATAKSDAFAGTDFTYGDVIGHTPADWLHKITGEEDCGGAVCRVVESTPATAETGTESGYSKRITWIRASDGARIRGTYFDISGALLKTYTAEDIRVYETPPGHVQPMRQTMANVQTGHSTRIEYDTFRPDVTPGADAFSPQTLDRGF